MDSEKKRELIERLEALADFANGGDGVTIGDATQTCLDAIAVIRVDNPNPASDGLKPCPFCGSSNLQIHKANSTTECWGCGAVVRVKDWNTRPDVQAGLVEALQSVVDWWLGDEMHNHSGAPSSCIFKVRAALAKAGVK